MRFVGTPWRGRSGPGSDHPWMVGLADRVVLGRSGPVTGHSSEGPVAKRGRASSDAGHRKGRGSSDRQARWAAEPSGDNVQEGVREHPLGCVQRPRLSTWRLFLWDIQIPVRQISRHTETRPSMDRRASPSGYNSRLSTCTTGCAKAAPKNQLYIAPSIWFSATRCDLTQNVNKTLIASIVAPRDPSPSILIGSPPVKDDYGLTLRVKPVGTGKARAARTGGTPDGN